MPKLWPVHYVLGLAGVALIRNWMAGGDTAKSCEAELIRVTNAFVENPAMRFEVDIPDMEVESGYELWAETYDDFHNPLIAAEQPVIERLLDSIAPGDALDAACGTGRYTRQMLARGHRVSAVDMSAQMIAKARTHAPEVEFRAGKLEALPYDSASFDLVMCGLALTHLPRLHEAIAQIGRVLRPGGRAILADHHPMAGFLGGSAIFQDSNRRYRNVKSYIHGISDYVKAFRGAELEILECAEPTLDEEHLGQGPLYPISPRAYSKGAVGMPFGLVWLLARR